MTHPFPRQFEFRPHAHLIEWSPRDIRHRLLRGTLGTVDELNLLHFETIQSLNGLQDLITREQYAEAWFRDCTPSREIGFIREVFLFTHPIVLCHSEWSRR